jgi:hypothetical protein
MKSWVFSREGREGHQDKKVEVIASISTMQTLFFRE